MANARTIVDDEDNGLTFRFWVVGIVVSVETLNDAWQTNGESSADLCFGTERDAAPTALDALANDVHNDPATGIQI